MKKTIIQVIQHLSPGGIEVMALELMRYNARNARIIILSLEGTRDSALKLWPKLEAFASDLIFLDKSPGIKPQLIFQLARLFRKYSADVIHTHHIGPLLYAGLAARLAKIDKHIHTEHDVWHLQETKRKYLEKYLLKCTNPMLVADARIVAANMKKMLNIQDIHVIHNGVDCDYFFPANMEYARSKVGLPQGIKLIGCSGRLEKVKGHEILLRAFARLHPSYHLAIAGSGSLEESLKNKAKQLGICNRVHFMGRIDDMPNFYRSLDIFCLPSLNEGYPLSSLEAQACGVPCVVTDVGASTETLCKTSGLFTVEGDPEQLSKALEKALNQQEYHSPRYYVETNGNIKDMAQAYANLCEIGGSAV